MAPPSLQGRAPPHNSGSMQVYIDEAQRLFVEEKYDEARKRLSKAIQSCKCKASAGLATTIAAVKQNGWRSSFEQLCRELKQPQQQQAAERNRPPRCSNPPHLKALHLALRCFKAKDNQNEAVGVALHVIHIAPRNLEAYVRLFSLVDSHALSSEDASLQLLARAFLGSVLTRLNISLPQASPEDRKLVEFIFRRRARNPMEVLPPEIQLMVFESFTTDELCGIIRVSRLWRDQIENNIRLWKKITINPRRKFLPRHLTKVLDRALRAQCTELHILDAKTFNLNRLQFLRILNALPQLQNLFIDDPRRTEGGFHESSQFYRELEYPDKARGRLRKLHLGKVAEHAPSFLQGIIRNNMALLEELSIVCWPQDKLRSVDLPNLPQLTSLRLVSFPRSRVGPGMPSTVRLGDMIPALPNLQHLHIDGFYFGLDAINDRWTSLKSIVIGQNARARNWDEVGDPTGRALPILGEQLLCIDFLSDDECLYRDIVMDQRACSEFDDEPITLSYPHLKYFRQKSRIPRFDNRLQQVLEPCLRGGCLETLVLPWETHTDEDVKETYSWASTPADNASGSSVTTLGLTNFAWENSWSTGATFDASPLLAWMAEFSNLSTMAFYPAPVPNAGFGLARMLKEFPGVKKVYEDCLSGQQRDDLLAAAQEKGVRIVHAKGGPVLVWPPKDIEWA